MIARRHNFQRVYDLAERVHPEWHDRRLAPLADTRRELVLQAVKALGVCKAAWIADYHRTRRSHPDPAQLAGEGALLRASVTGWDAPVHIHPDHRELAQRAAAADLSASVTTLLSPSTRSSGTAGARSNWPHCCVARAGTAAHR